MTKSLFPSFDSFFLSHLNSTIEFLLVQNLTLSDDEKVQLYWDPSGDGLNIQSSRLKGFAK